MIIVTFLAGPRTGEKFVTPADGLHDGLRFPYIDGSYSFTRDAPTGRWGAIPAAEDRTPTYQPAEHQEDR
jgi:hypothetical protein